MSYSPETAGFGTRAVVITESKLRRSLGVRLGRFRMYAPRPLPIRNCVEPATPETLRFAIVTPVRDQQSFIARTIRSVLDQRYGNLDYIVQDGASTDGTLAVAESFVDPCLRVASKRDGGLAHALNAGFATVAGDVMGYLNADDLLLPGALHYVGSYLAAHPNVDVVYGHRIVIDELDREIGRWVLPSHSNRVLSWDDYLPQETVFWRKRIWDEAGARFDEDLRFAMDWDLWLRFRDCGARFVRLPRYLGAFRVHAFQKTATQMAGIGQHEMNALRLRNLKRTPGLLARAVATAPYLVRHVALSGADRLFGIYR